MLSLDIQLNFSSYQLSTKLDINAGEIVGLYGKSGIGKSTLLKVISGLYVPKFANISFNKTLWNTANEGIITPPQKRSIGMVFQDFALFPHLTVLKNIQYSQRIPEKELMLLIDTLEIKDILQKKTNHISGGQKQRVAIGRAIVYDPNVLLMDEPFAALDDEVKNSIKLFLKTYIADKEKIAIIASHDRQDLEFFTNKIVTLAPDTDV